MMAGTGNLVFSGDQYFGAQAAFGFAMEDVKDTLTCTADAPWMVSCTVAAHVQRRVLVFGMQQECSADCSHRW